MKEEVKKEEKKLEKGEKLFKLSLIMKHKGVSFNLGRHKIVKKPAEYALNEAEQKELASKGCQAWLIDHNAKK